MRLSMKWFTIFASLFATILGCTRKIDTQSLKVSFAPQSSVGSQSISGALQIAFVNIQLANGPLVYKFDYEENPLAAGQVVTIEIPDVPRGEFLVQFLGVYKSDAQSRVIAYDDSLIDIKAGVNDVYLTATSVGTFSREARLAGRYIDSAGSPEGGPTGTLVMQFQPPAGAPKMNILKFPIVDGWFQVLGLDGTPLSYVLEETGQTIFDSVVSASGVWSVNGTALSTGNHLAQFSVPAYWRRSGVSSAEDRPPMDLFLGYFQKPGLNVLTTKKVCVPNDVVEGTRYFSDSNATNRVDIDLSSVNPLNIYRVAGGATAPQNQVYTETATPCGVSASEDRITAYHTLLSEDGGNGGVAPPFAAIKPFSPLDHFVSANFAYVPSNRLTLKWGYLGGISSIDGVAVFARVNSSSNSTWRPMETCDGASKNGFSEVGAVAFPATSFVFASSSITAANRKDWAFLLCPYKFSGASRKWIGNYVAGGGTFDLSPFHTGWAPSTQNFTGSGSETFFGRGAKISQVASVDATTYDKYTVLSIANLAAWAAPVAGSEVAITVVGRGTAGGCGTYNGSLIDVGDTTFARVLWSQAGTPHYVKIPKGSFVDSLDGNTLGGSMAGVSHCQVSISQVLQYRNLDLSSTTSFSSGFTAFNFANESSLLALRVNGLLTLGATTIDANYVGYIGGSTGSVNSAGIRRDSNALGSSSTGGLGAANAGDSAGGGGGINNGGDGTVAGSAGAGYIGAASLRFVMGGGGGGGYSGEAGGAGGGAILISAKNVSLSGNAVISAHGDVGNSGTSYSGGGAGGSVNFIARSVVRSGLQTLSIRANGDGGGGGSAGGGGGGSAIGLICTSNVPEASLTALAQAGSGGSSAAQAGYTSFSVSPANPLCGIE